NSQDGALMKALAPVRPVKGQQLAAWAARSQGAARQRQDTCRSDLDKVLHRFRAVSTSTVDGRTSVFIGTGIDRGVRFRPIQLYTSGPSTACNQHSHPCRRLPAI